MEQFDGCSVIFHNILEWYSPTENISCNFSLKTSIDSKEQTDCFVAIFHVGWDSLVANITRRSFSLCETLSENNFQVDFPSAELPKNNPDEFYQFCFYNVNSEVVYGASCPFQICSRGDEPFIVCGKSPRDKPESSTKNGINLSSWMEENIEINEEDDFATVMVVKKNQMEKNLSKFKIENESLQKCNDNLKNQFEKSDLESTRQRQEIEISKKKIVLLETNNEESQKVINHLNEQMKHMKEDITTNYEEKIREMTVERDTLESDRAKAHLEIGILSKDLQDEKQKFNTKLSNLTNELVLEKKSSQLLKNQHQSAMEKLGQTQNAYCKDLEEAKQLQMELNKLEFQIKSEKDKNVTMTFEYERLTKLLEETQQELKDKENDMTSIQISLRENVEVMKGELKDSEELLKTLTTQNIELSEKESALTNTNKELKERIQELEQEFEGVCKMKTEEFEKLTSEIERQAELIHESNSQVHTLELKLDEKNNKITEMENDFEEERGQTEIIMEELRSKVEELQENQVAEADEETNKPKSSTMTKSEGSYYALQVAYNFIQKQLKQFKTENEELRRAFQQGASPPGESQKNTSTMAKENSELKLRLEFGKQAFEEKFKECEQLKTNLKTSKNRSSIPLQPTSYNTFELKEEKEKLEAELIALKRKLTETQTIEIQLKKQLQKQANRIQKNEDESSLIIEENKLLKAQVSALLEGGATATIRRKFDPSMQTETKQQQAPKSPEIAYPPSMIKIDRDQRDSAWSPTNHQQHLHQQQLQQYKQQQQYQLQQQLQQQCQQQPPQIQTIPNRVADPSRQHVPNHKLQGRGQANIVSSSIKGEKSRCPVCTYEFPAGFSDMMANQHVNDHFKK